MEMQKLFFKKIKDRLPFNVRLAEIVSEILNISVDSAYRRIRCEKELTFSELTKLSVHFNISVDSIFNVKSNNIVFKYIPLDMSNMNDHYTYIDNLAAILETISFANNKEIRLMALDIPIMHCMPFRELVLFKVYTWAQNLNKTGITDTYEKFVETLDKDYLLKHYTKLSESYDKIPSVEIWSENTINPVLHLLDYYSDLNYFENKENVLNIARQLIQAIELIEKQSEKGFKDGDTQKIPFQLYISPTELPNDVSIMKHDESNTALIKLYTINNISTTNEYFCTEVEKWIQNNMLKSLLISGASERERFNFFNQQKNKVYDLINKVENKK
jgi:hypothetical protein